jgi:serine/threonine-protein kinase RsbW
MAEVSPVRCSVVVESRPSAIVNVYKQILSKLQKNSFSEDDIFAVHLALGEAFINAVKHGNKMNPDKKVRIDYSVGADKIEIYVTDQGEGFNPKAVPDPRLGENLYKLEGRGMLLINSYMDVVQYNQQGNRVYMVRYREKPGITGS